MSETIEVRSEVAKFAAEMEKVLQKNDHKSGWEGIPMVDLFYLISLEFDELKDVHDEYHTITDVYITDANAIRYSKYVQRMREEAIDIANFCMMLCDNYPEDDTIEK